MSNSTIIWTHKLKKALGKVMDPGETEYMLDLFWKVIAELVGRNDGDEVQSHDVIVPWRTDDERENFWSNWYDALGDNASLYDREVVEDAIDDILNNHRLRVLFGETVHEKPTSFDILPLVWLNPRSCGNHSMMTTPPFFTSPAYSKLDAITVFMRRNPLATDLLSVMREEYYFVDLMIDKDEELFRHMARSGQLGSNILMTSTISKKTMTDAFLNLANWFSYVGLQPLSDLIMVGIKNNIASEVTYSEEDRLLSGVSRSVYIFGGNPFWDNSLLDAISANMIQHKGKTLEMLALRKGWINVFLRSFDAQPYVPLYDAFV